MSDIDPEKLEIALEEVDAAVLRSRADVIRDVSITITSACALMGAARALLAKLEKIKTVEVVQWASVDSSGEVIGIWDHESQARESLDSESEVVVRLTGTAKVKVTP